MRFILKGADRETARERALILDAESTEAAMAAANRNGLLVSSCKGVTWGFLWWVQPDRRLAVMSRLISAVMLATLLALTFAASETDRLDKLESVSPQEYYDYAKFAAGNPHIFLAGWFALIILIGLYEGIAYLLRKLWRFARKGSA